MDSGMYLGKPRKFWCDWADKVMRSYAFPQHLMGMGVIKGGSNRNVKRSNKGRIPA